MDAFDQLPSGLRPRDANKFASTNVTNEIVVAINGGFATGATPTRDVFARMMTLILTGRHPDGGGPQVYQAKAYANAGGGSAIADYSLDGVIGGVILDDVLFINVLGDIGEDVAGVTCEGRLLHYTGGDTPIPVFIGMAIKIVTCPSS